MTEKPVAIVTASSRGIGEAIARELAARGYALALMSRSGGAMRVADELGGIGITGSVLDQADIDRLVAAAMDAYGRIDAVVSNSGRHSEVLKAHGITATPTVTGARLSYEAGFKPDILAYSDQVWHDDLDLMVLNCVKVARAATPHLLAGGGGAIVNIAGMEAAQPRVAYPLASVRLALHGFTKIYSDRYASEGIRMNCVLPGMIENAAAAAKEPTITEAIPLGRFGSLTEIARTVAFLLSEDAGYITGQMILADGGLNRAI